MENKVFKVERINFPKRMFYYVISRAGWGYFVAVFGALWLGLGETHLFLVISSTLVVNCIFSLYANAYRYINTIELNRDSITFYYDFLWMEKMVVLPIGELTCVMKKTSSSGKSHLFFHHKSQSLGPVLALGCIGKQWDMKKQTEVIQCAKEMGAKVVFE